MSDLVAIDPSRETSLQNVQMGFANSASFELMQRAAKMLTNSTLVPVAYRARTELKEYGKVTGYEDNPSGFSNCVVALNMAQRMGADPLMVMQNLYIVEGRPSWSSQFIIAAINSCGKYSPLRFDLSAATEPEEVTYSASEWQDPPGGGKARKVTVQKKVIVRHQQCVAWAIEKETGERLESPTISIQMAIDEGWLTKNGSKWLTMPEVMLRYRSAAFFGKLYAPELLMGLQTAEEAHDIIDVRADGSVSFGGVEDGNGRAPAAEVVQPKSKKEKSAAASAPVTPAAEHVDQDGVIEKSTQREPDPVQQPAQQTQQQPKQATREPGSDDGFEGTPISNSVMRVLKTKMEQNAISESDIKKKFGFNLAGVTTANYNAVADFVESPV